MKDDDRFDDEPCLVYNDEIERLGLGTMIIWAAIAGFVVAVVTAPAIIPIQEHGYWPSPAPTLSSVARRQATVLP